MWWAASPVCSPRPCITDQLTVMVTVCIPDESGLFKVNQVNKSNHRDTMTSDLWVLGFGNVPLRYRSFRSAPSKGLVHDVEALSSDPQSLNLVAKAAH